MLIAIVWNDLLCCRTVDRHINFSPTQTIDFALQPRGFKEYLGCWLKENISKQVYVQKQIMKLAMDNLLIISSTELWQQQQWQKILMVIAIIKIAMKFFKTMKFFLRLELLLIAHENIKVFFKRSRMVLVLKNVGIYWEIILIKVGFFNVDCDWVSYKFL